LRRHSPARDALEFWGAALVLKTLEHSPRPLAERLARFYARLLDLAAPRLRRTAMRNLEMALPETTLAQRRRIADGVFRSIARLLISFARIPRIRNEMDSWVRLEGIENFEAGRQRGKGVIFSTGHLGNWEMGAWAHGVFSAPMHVVVRPLDNPRLDELVARLRAVHGNRVIEKSAFARGILKALAANEAVGILIDQNTSAEEGVFADFFGIPACVNPGIARIAAHSGASVVPAFALWSDAERRYVVRYYPPVEITGDAVDDTRRLQKQLEDVIREYPDQWLWIHRRWKTRPQGEPPLY
jgi:KDO2-lipid IV(A) lauroyltransferase